MIKMDNRTTLFGFMTLLCLGLGFAYTVGDGNCSGVESSALINLSTAIDYNNSYMEITYINDNNIAFSGYNDTEDWYPEGLWVGFKVDNVPETFSNWEYIQFDVNGIDWGQDKYSGYFIIEFCNTTTVGKDDIEVCNQYKYNLDGLPMDLLYSDSGTRFKLTPTGCRYWNKSEPYYYWYDSEPCEYTDREFSEMRVFAWAEYGQLEPFTGTIGNITLVNGENKLTSYDCADEASFMDAFNQNYTSGWKLVTGILQSYPTTEKSATYNSGWEAKKSTLENPDLYGANIVLVDENAYAFPIYYDSGMNITEFASYRDGYHNVTLRYLYDATTWNINGLHVNSDNGIVDEIPTVYLDDYTNEIENYKLQDEGVFYLNAQSKFNVPADGTPIHRIYGMTNYCEDSGYTYDGQDYTYQYCYDLIDFTNSPITYEQFISGYALTIRHPLNTDAEDFWGKTLIGTGIFGFIYLPSGYTIYDRPSLTNFDAVGDAICGSLESSYPSDWNYSPDCRFGGITGYASAVGARSMQIFTLFIGAVFIIMAVLIPMLSLELTLEKIITSAVVLIIGVALISVGMSLIITP
jgi:hypothetical protein